MIIMYRTNENGGWDRHNRETRKGKFVRLTRASKKPPRPPCFPSESDWMVPNLRDPYGQAATL